MKIADAVKYLVSQNQFLMVGFVHDIINTTKLAEFLKPKVEALTESTVSVEALKSHLLKTKHYYQKIKKHTEKFCMHNLTVQSNLVTLSFYKNPDVRNTIREMEKVADSRNIYFCFFQGSNEYTVVYEKRLDTSLDLKSLPKPKHHQKNVSCLIIKYPNEYASTPGFLYSVLQVIAFQGVNVVDVVSTFSEFSIFIDQKDLRVSFEVLNKTLSHY